MGRIGDLMKQGAGKLQQSLCEENFRSMMEFDDSYLSSLKNKFLYGSVWRDKIGSTFSSIDKVFNEKFGARIQRLLDTKAVIEKELADIAKNSLNPTAPEWPTKLAIILSGLEKLKTQLIETISSNDYTAYRSSFKDELKAWGEYELRRLEREVRRFKSFNNAGQEYPVDYYLFHLLDNLHVLHALCLKKYIALKVSDKDLLRLPGEIFNQCLSVYFKLQNELVKADKISPLQGDSNIFVKNTIAAFYDEKIKFAETVKLVSEDDRRFIIDVWQKAKARHLKRNEI